MNLRDKKIDTILSKTGGFSRADLRQTDSEGRTVLMHAAIRGDVDRSRAIIAAGAGLEAGVPRDAASEQFEETPPAKASSGVTDEPTAPRPDENISELRKAVLSEISQRMRPTVAQPTQELIDAIEEEKYDWQKTELASVDVLRVAHHILDKEDNTRVNLYDDALLTLVHLLTEIAENDPRWMRAVLSKLKPNIYHSTMFGDGFEPRVLWNGAVLIRNGHRVLGMKYSETAFYDADTRVRLLEEVGQLGGSGTIITEHDGVVWYVSDTQKMNLNGNNIVVISDVDVLEQNEVLTPNFLENTASQSRGGAVALRLFQSGMHLYELFRADDELDFTIDSTHLAPVYKEGDELPIGDFAGMAFPETFSPDSNTFGDSTRDMEMWKRERDKSRRIVDEAIRVEFFGGRVEAVDDLPEVSRTEAAGVLEALNAQLCESMGSEIQKRILWFPTIFADSPDRIRGFMGSYTASAVSPSVDHHILVVFSVDGGGEDSETNIDSLSNNSGIEAVLLSNEPRATDISFEINIPNSLDDWGPWIPAEPQNVAQLKDRLTHICKMKDCSITDIIGGRLLRCCFTLPNLERIEIDQFGAGFGGELSNLCEAGGMVLSGWFQIIVPSMGIYQSFSGPDIDSGNL
ncbi:MAG: hypothetical protein PF508_21700 [Spirochaeta sp.]|jgi:hypothetical protein|nr:hypothetical protein [Spirochaeta sp.]